MARRRASAVGLEALQRLIQGPPPDLPAAGFVVVPCAPNFPGVLPELLQRHGPPGEAVRLRFGPAIDPLFRSAAEHLAARTCRRPTFRACRRALPAQAEDRHHVRRPGIARPARGGPP